MQLKSLKTYFQNALLGYYPDEEIKSFFYIASEAFLNYKRIDVSLHSDDMIKGEVYHQFQDVIERLQAYEPIQYILGETEFYGLKFKVNGSVLIPRPETEELIDWILKDIDKNAKLSILDIGTGSGCIPIVLAKYLPNANVYSLDISNDALQVARSNAELNNVTVKFIQKDVLDENIDFSTEKFDVIVSNPPYVKQSEKQLMQTNVLNYEPHLALFVEDNDALIFYKRIVELSKSILKPNGLLYFEINEGLGEGTKDVMKSEFEAIELRQDISGKNRMIKGIKI